MFFHECEAKNVKGRKVIMSTIGSMGFTPTANKGMKFFPIGCDMPEQGGISGNIKVNKKPSPFVLEERPAVYNPITGQTVYRDTIKPRQACWLG